jgi:hypothetical protein
MDRLAGAEALRAAAQDHGIAGFQTERAGIRGDVGTAFENHRDHAEWHTDALDHHAVGPLPARSDRTDRIGDVADHGEAVGDGGDAGFRQHQTVDKG